MNRRNLVIRRFNRSGPLRSLRLEPLEHRCFLSLGTSALTEGPVAGSDSDLVESSGAWTANAKASWLHTTSSGSGNGLATFTFDANPGATRSGTLTIAGQTLTVTQAGSGYVAAGLATIVPVNDISVPSGVAVDGAGNVYIADSGTDNIKEWTASTQAVSTLTTGNEISVPSGVAVDGAGNVYIADSGTDNIKEWNASTQAVSTIVPAGEISVPSGVAVDGAGNVYIADSGNDSIEKWSASTQTVSTIAGGYEISVPSGVAVDGAGNVYIADSGTDNIKEWNASTQTVSTVVPEGEISVPSGVAVDGAGNVYIADSGNDSIEKWNASTQAVSTIVPEGEISVPSGVAVDGAGNVYIADSGNDTIEELPRAFIPGGAVSVGASAGSAALLPVLPTNQSLTGVFAPSSDQGWLTITNVSDGVVQFSFAQNTGDARTAQITVLGRQITVTQAMAAMWSGGGFEPTWSDAANWGGTPVAADDSLIFGGTTRLSNTNNLSAGTQFAGITFDANAGAFFLNGNSLSLGGDITSNSADTQTINLSLTLVGGSRTIDTPSGEVTIAGSIGQSGGNFGITKTGSGTLVLSGANSYAGGTVVNAGTLVVTSASALLDGTSLTVGAGADAIFDSVEAVSITTAASVSAPIEAVSSPSTVQSAAPAVDVAATFVVSAPIVAAGTAMNSVFAAPALSTHSPRIERQAENPSHEPAVISPAAIDAVFKSYRSAHDRTVSSPDVPQYANLWPWFAAIESSWNSSNQNRTADLTVAALDKLPGPWQFPRRQPPGPGRR